MRKAVYFILIFGAMIIFIGLGFYLLKNNDKKNQDQELAFDNGWKALEARIIDSGMILPDEEVYSFMGDIYEKNNNELSIELAYKDPFLSPELDRRKVIVSPDTKIYGFFEKNNDEYQEEMADYLMKNENRGPDGAVGIPVLFLEKIFSIDDVKSGQRITVKTENNIKLEKEFIAKEIILH